ncbi:hypothetical protein EI067_30370 [Mycobacterium paragordonae]|uniref:HEPN domain-containing protein n=1 Tax=Mycobacterium paragordonae TaxID=1389713 RepID=UPI00105D1ED0|nr:HEPN domain-containing protein [Mycobacterium paragordonae]TDK86066.1 hypothetical protein EI067_30370 [Mycobacterium paragordonae]
MTTQETSRALNGTFWQSDTPDRPVPGQLTLAGRPALEAIGQIFIESANTVDLDADGMVRCLRVSGNSDALVADFEPRNIHGELDDGTLVSVVGAQGRRKINNPIDVPYRQSFRTMRHVILHEHVDERQRFESCKFRVVGPQWWQVDDERSRTSDGGQLAIVDVGGDRWFEFTPTQSLTVSDFDRNVLSPARTLASLVTDNPSTTTELHVRRAENSPWRKVHRVERLVPSQTHELLDSRHLSADRFTRWVDFRRRSDALDAAAIDDHSGASIQTTVLTLAAVAEGLHRRLFSEGKRVPALSKSDLRQARRAARLAAVARIKQLDRSGRSPLTADDIAEFESAMNDSFGFINQQTFRSRMLDLANAAAAAVPNIVDSFADWPKAVHAARNTLAHRETRQRDDSTDQFYELTIALSYSLGWVLRTVLLIEAGFDAETLQRAYRDSSRYTHHIANTRTLLAGSDYAAQ